MRTAKRILFCIVALVPVLTLTHVVLGDRPRAGPPERFRLDEVTMIAAPNTSPGATGLYASPDGRTFIGLPHGDGTVEVRRWTRRYARPSGSTQYRNSSSES